MDSQSQADDGSPSPNSHLPLLLSIVAGAGTFVGGCVLLMMLPEPPPSSSFPPRSSYLFGRLQAASAGVMLTLSVNLLIESYPTVGFWDCTLWMIGGAAVMLIIEKLIPDADEADMLDLEKLDGDDKHKQYPPSPKAGTKLSWLQWCASWFGHAETSPQVASLARTGFVTYLGLALHNLPEGVSVAVSTASSVKLGVSLCVAIMLHNVLEGMVVALPLWFATASRPRVLFLTLINGFMEPAGVILVWLLGGEYFLEGPGRVERILCAVAGVMGAISFGELVPNAAKWIQRGAASTTTHSDILIDRFPFLRRWISARVAIWTLVGMLAGWVVMSSANLILTLFTKEQ